MVRGGIDIRHDHVGIVGRDVRRRLARQHRSPSHVRGLAILIVGVCGLDVHNDAIAGGCEMARQDFGALRREVVDHEVFGQGRDDGEVAERNGRNR